jgi:crotonobetainyl-CoA:carnitine CoA-transferase CaiB-like acyl-CoA transferase
VTRPFEGVTILDFSHVLTGPYASSLFALCGARVIKIEQPGIGDLTRKGSSNPVLAERGLSPGFQAVNVGKEAITIDLKSEEGVAIVKQLAARADVVLENFRPGVLDRLGLGQRQLSAINPALIYCSISGFGQDGPLAQEPAYDGKIQAMSGIMSMTGEIDGSPMRAGFAIADNIAGLNAAFAIAAALHQRGDSGRGQVIDVAMLDSMLSLMAPTVLDYLTTGEAPKRIGNMAISKQPTADLFQTADGHILLAVNTDAQVATLLREIGRDDLADDPRFTDRHARVEHADALVAAVTAGLARATSAEWEARLNKAGAPCGMINTIPDILGHAHVGHRGQMFQIDNADCTVQGEGPAHFVNTGFQFLHGGPTTDRPPPMLGQDTEALLEELGYTPDTIAGLKERGVV